MSDGIYTKPGATFVALLDGAPLALAGTIGWQLVELDTLTVTYPRSTAGIVEIGAGAYRLTATAPAIADAYLILWDTGVATPEYASERLTVNATGSAPAIGSGYGEPFYTTIDGLRIATGTDANTLPDEQAVAILTIAEDWIDRISGPVELDADTGRKHRPASLAVAQLIKLSDATLAIAKVLHSEPAAFTAPTAGKVSGPDFTIEATFSANGLSGAASAALRDAASKLDAARLRTLRGVLRR